MQLSIVTSLTSLSKAIIILTIYILYIIVFVIILDYGGVYMRRAGQVNCVSRKFFSFDKRRF